MRMLLLRTNAGDQRARAIDSTQVKTADRGLRLHRIVLTFSGDRARASIGLCIVNSR
jgi:hypothetical protein